MKLFPTRGKTLRWPRAKRRVVGCTERSQRGGARRVCEESRGVSRTRKLGKTRREADRLDSRTGNRSLPRGARPKGESRNAAVSSPAHGKFPRTAARRDANKLFLPLYSPFPLLPSFLSNLSRMLFILKQISRFARRNY